MTKSNELVCPDCFKAHCKHCKCNSCQPPMKDVVRNKTPKEHHNCPNQYASWETSDENGRTLAWCYGCSRTWFTDTGEEGPNYRNPDYKPFSPPMKTKTINEEPNMSGIFDLIRYCPMCKKKMKLTINALNDTVHALCPKGHYLKGTFRP